MKKLDFVKSAVNMLIIATVAGPALAQTPPPPAPTVQADLSPAGSPAGGGDGVAGGATSGYAAGYAPSARYNGGMVTGGNTDGYIPATREALTPPQGVADPMVMTPLQLQGYEQALRQTFPMNPDMIRYYRELAAMQQRAMLERPEPTGNIGSGVISLEPGEAPPDLHLASGIPSVVSFYDQTGASWPITQYVHGQDGQFQVLQLGRDSNSLTVSPLTPFGFTNLIVMLKDEPKPVIVRLRVSDTVVDDRKDLQIMKNGPNAVIMPDIVANPAVGIEREAGTHVMMAALNGADLPASAQMVNVSGVSAQAWLINDKLYIRTRARLSVPMPQDGISGPDGLRVYVVDQAPVLTFIDNGRVIMANVDLP